MGNILTQKRHKQEDTEIMDPKKTIGFNHVAKEPNVSHTNVDNMYVKKVIARISRATLGKGIITDLWKNQ